MTTDADHARVITFVQHRLAGLADGVDVVDLHRIVVDVRRGARLDQEIVVVLLDPPERRDPLEDLVRHLEAEPVEEEGEGLFEMWSAEHEVAQPAWGSWDRFGDRFGAGAGSILLTRVIPSPALGRGEQVRGGDVDDDSVLKDGVDTGEPRVGDLRLDAHVADTAGDVGEIQLGLAAHVQLGHVPVSGLGHPQLNGAVSRPQHTVGSPEHAAPLPEVHQLVGVGNTEFDVEESVECHRPVSIRGE